MLVYKEHKSRLLRWGLWAVITGLLGGALCEFKKEGGLIPINKNLWYMHLQLQLRHIIKQNYLQVLILRLRYNKLIISSSLHLLLFSGYEEMVEWKTIFMGRDERYSYVCWTQYDI